MSKIGLFYGTQTGKTESIAEIIQEQLGASVVTIHDMSQAEVADFNNYQNLIIGAPTWNIGELSSDWDAFFPDLDEIDFSGKTIAYFGVGDQIGYADNFLDAIGILEEKISELGGKTVCSWPVDGYDFSESRGVRDGKFIGLALDEDNQGDLTESRIQAWVVQVKQAFGI
jgi:flavodoxin I